MKKIDWTCPECGGKKIYCWGHNLATGELLGLSDDEDEIIFKGNEKIDAIYRMDCDCCGHPVFPEDPISPEEAGDVLVFLRALVKVDGQREQDEQ